LNRGQAQQNRKASTCETFFDFSAKSSGEICSDNRYLLTIKICLLLVINISFAIKGLIEKNMKTPVEKPKISLEGDSIRLHALCVMVIATYEKLVVKRTVGVTTVPHSKETQ